MRRINRQKGLQMNELQKLSAIKLPWDTVSQHVGEIASVILSRSITCTAKGEDGCYWSIAAERDTFRNSEITQLVASMDGGMKMMRDSLPSDSNTSRSLGMDLCRALLQQSLGVKWEQEFVTKEALYLVGVSSDFTEQPFHIRNSLYVDSKFLDFSDLISKDAFVQKLFSEGGTFADFTAICEQYEQTYGTPLYWAYPITDGRYNGCYLVLVQEGILAISYNVIDEQDHEVFEPESVRLCDAEEIRCLLNDWNIRSAELVKSLRALLFFLERKEEQGNA